LAYYGGSGNSPHFPKCAVYAGTRAYVVTFSQILATELAGTGVRVQALCPGVVATEFHTRQGMDLSKLPRMNAEDVVTASLAGLELGEVVCAPSLEDPTALDRVREAAAAVTSGAWQRVPAKRYTAS
jgi:short-subunit dehydrogenase